MSVDLSPFELSDVTAAFRKLEAAINASSGGGGSVSLTADTDIAAGTSVSVNSAGNAVQTWGPAPNIAGVVSIIPASLIGAPYFAYINPQDATHFIGWTTINGAALAAVVACSISGDSISSGTPVVLEDLSLYNIIPLSNSLFVGFGGEPAQVIAGTISSLAITLGTDIEVSDIGYGATGIALNSTTFLMAGGISGPNIQAGTVSGTAITLGTAVNVGTENVAKPQMVALSASLFVLAYGDGAGSNNLTLVAGTVSGTTITLGTPVATDLTIQQCAGIAKLSATKFVVLALDGISTSYQALVGSVSTTTTTLGAPLAVSGPSAVPPDLGANGTDIPHPSIAVVDATHVAFGAGKTLPKIYTVSGLTLSGPSPSFAVAAIDSVVTAGSLLVVSDTLANVYEVDQTTGRQSPIFPHVNLSQYGLSPITSTTVLAWFFNNLLDLQTRVITVKPIASAPIGCVADDVTSGDSATVTLSGACDGFSGLTPGTQYFANGDGTLTSADTGHSIGFAKTATQLIVQPK